jgi:isopentenyl diphosphate isomerase/L-lactate dehydrogenase-like FMN-dependent dehydrogenase
VTEATRWLERHTAHAPPVLRERVRHWADRETAGELPARLAEAGFRALAEVERHPGDRSAALDLLAADALVTLALLAEAERAPASLHAFAGRMLARAAAPA